MMAILPILFIVILDLNQVRKQRIADNYISHSHEAGPAEQAPPPPPTFWLNNDFCSIIRGIYGIYIYGIYGSAPPLSFLLRRSCEVTGNVQYLTE